MSIDNNEEHQMAEPTVRLCMLRTWPQHFDGYGFNLHAEKSKTSVVPANGSSTGTAASGLPFSGGQYIGKVDRGSPAESAGLREGDRIVQVDGQDIEGETHSKVVARIKKGSAPEPGSNDADNSISRCSLLVVDRRADTYYKENGIRVHSNMGLQVLVLRTPEEPTPECLALQPNVNDSSPKTASIGGAPVVDDSADNKQQQQNDGGAEDAPPTSAAAAAKTPAAAAGATTLNLNMTAAELRRRLAERKRQDSRRTAATGDGSLDFRKKYEIVDKL
ncbi:PDZ domain [Cinara cedri]|uniref:PDZ domain n=1 Tax=Cinara cedri TaxID=506608 RepID=A0A5E4NTD7_9HEMI|nr:PDZ domain [Cinara cedri]